MTTFKCKMCGGTLEINNQDTIAECEYCGSKQTIPKLDNDRKANLYDRANHFRRNNEFDKATGIYEQILNEDGTDAEAYWSLVLCCYGIEYVEDPTSHKRVPTVNRAQYTSIFDDDNYKSALQYADSYQKIIYEEEAKTINEIQKGILAISQQEEPFDIFICYKETDNSGRRTPDSVLANDLYHQLTQEGFKVFFARITLEDKLGSAYEPYIFAALNSAKVMVVLGTKPECFNAVWVKNEWRRYLALIKNGAKKMLVPAYRDMDPYDLPEEFSHLQAQDMSKLGFMQDLIRGIKKIAQEDVSQTTVIKETVVPTSNTNIAPLLKRAFMFLEDGNWDEADKYCEKVLDIEPENAQAYVGKLMAEFRVREMIFLEDCVEPLHDNVNYQKAVRFGDETLKANLIEYNEHILERIETARKDAILADGKAKMTGDLVSNYSYAIQLFNQISGWKDADEHIKVCQRKIEEIKVRQEVERLEFERKVEEEQKEAERTAKRNKRIAVITTPIVCVVVAFIIILNGVIIPNGQYKDALALMDAGKYKNALEVFESITGYKEEDCKYNKAICLQETGNIIAAYENFIELEGYIDSKKKAEDIREEYLILTAEEGDYVYFGNYEQDNDTSNGKEQIEWLVLRKEDNKIFLVSRLGLDCKPYHNADGSSVTWKNCSLREWLNDSFMSEAFSKTEQEKISLEEAVPAIDDLVFLPDKSDASIFMSVEERRCGMSDYAIAQGVKKNNVVDYEEESYSWWLCGDEGWSSALCVFPGLSDDDIVLSDMQDNDTAVRPALWINLNKYTE